MSGSILCFSAPSAHASEPDVRTVREKQMTFVEVNMNIEVLELVESIVVPHMGIADAAKTPYKRYHISCFKLSSLAPRALRIRESLTDCGCNVGIGQGCVLRVSR